MNLYAALGGDIALTLVRMSVSFGSGWAAWTMTRMLRRKPSHRQITLIPRAVVWFTTFWSVSTLITSVALLATDAPTVTGPLRTWYGVTLAWQIFGMAWVLAIGTTSSISALEAMDKIRSIADSDSQGGDVS